MLALLAALSLGAVAAQDTVPEPVVIDLRIGRITGTTVQAFRVRSEVLLPLSQFFQLVEIRHRLTPDGRLEATVDPGNLRIVIDPRSDSMQYGGRRVKIEREFIRYESAELKPGCGANAILNLCALGVRVQAIGLVGDDPVGRRLRELLREAGTDDSAVFTVEGPTSTKTRVLAGGKNTRRQQMLRIDRDGPKPPGPALAQKLLKALAQAAAKCDAIMVSDYGLGLLTPSLVEGVRSLAAQERTVCVDARYGLAKYRGVTVVKPNEVELEQAVGRPIGDDPLALEEAGRELLKSLRAQAMLVTRGRNGMALLRPGAPTAGTICCSVMPTPSSTPCFPPASGWP